MVAFHAFSLIFSLLSKILLSCSVPSHNGISDVAEFSLIHVNGAGAVCSNYATVVQVKGPRGFLPFRRAAWPAHKELGEDSKTRVTEFVR